MKWPARRTTSGSGRSANSRRRSALPMPRTAACRKPEPQPRPGWQWCWSVRRARRRVKGKLWRGWLALAEWRCLPGYGGQAGWHLRSGAACLVMVGRAQAAALGRRRASKIAPRRGSHAPRAGPAFRISKKRERPMNNVEQDYTQPLGLDVGTSRMVVARAKDKRQEYDSQLNAFLTLPYSKLAESLLQRENVFHEVQGAEIVVAGNDAEKFAEAFHVETRRPMANGVLNPEEPHSLAVVRRIVTKLVGRAAAEGQKVFFSVPAQGEGLNG